MKKLETEMNITFDELNISKEEAEEEPDILLDSILNYLYELTDNKYNDIGFDVYSVNDNSVDICGIKYCNTL